MLDTIYKILDSQHRTSLWLIFIFSLSTFLAIISKEDGQYFVNVTTFAASFVSITLAVVAIRFSEKANDQFSDSISKLNDITINIKENVNDVRSKLSGFINTTEKKDAPQSGEPARAAVNAEQEDDNEKLADNNAHERVNNFGGETPRIGEKIAYYILASAERHRQYKFDLKLIFKNNPALYYYLGGILHHIANNPESEFYILYKGLRFKLNINGKTPFEKYCSMRLEDENWPEIKKMIDFYFASL